MAVVREPKEIKFENLIFHFFTDGNNDASGDSYHLKSEGNKIKFESGKYHVVITTSKFPNGMYGYGYRGNALNDDRICICSGKGGGACYDNEFLAQVAGIKKQLKWNINSSYDANIITKQMENFINPKTLF